MQLNVSELAALVGGQFASKDGGFREIRGVAGVVEAGEGDVTFLASPRYVPALRRCRATAALVPVSFSDDIPPVAIRVEDPARAFAALLTHFAPEPVRFAPGVHPTAVLGPGVQLGEEVSIQPYAVLEEGAVIGAKTVIGAHTYVGHGARVGDDCQIAARVTIGARCVVGSRVILHSGVVLGSDGFGFEFSGGRHVKIPQTGIVQIDDDVEIGANSAVDRARFGRTRIGEGTKIDNLVQVGHNVVIGKHCIVCGQTGIAGSTRIGDYVTIAGQAGIVGHIEIGDQVIVGGRAGVSNNVRPKEVLLGSPARPMAEAKEQMARVNQLPKLYARVKRLEESLRSNLSDASPPT